MSELSVARSSALACVSERRRRKARMRDVLAHNAELAKLTDSERAFASRLALMCTLYQAQLDSCLNRELTKPKSLEPRVRDALRLSTTELLYFDTPEQVVVSQGVELVRSITPRAAGLANAVLRKLCTTAKPQFIAARRACEQGSAGTDEIALCAGIPDWLAKELVLSLGPHHAANLALSQLEAAPIWVVANPRYFSPDSFAHALAAQDFEFVAHPWKDCVQLSNAAGLRTSDLLAQGKLFVSDLSAQLICMLAAPQPGETLLELGQGNATKSLLMASLSYKQAPKDTAAPAHIYGIELHQSRVRHAQARLKAAGFDAWVSTQCMDGRELTQRTNQDLPQYFDRVFVDAPCSGTGTMRRHPEIPTTLEPASVKTAGSLLQLQAELLHAAATRVIPGGLLIYSTCSVLRQENAGIVQQFLNSEQGACFEVLPLNQLDLAHQEPAIIAELQACVTEEGYFQSYPRIAEKDGHFCAVMRRLS